MPSKGSKRNRKSRKEPTVKCPNCGALMPPTLPECFICDEKIAELPAVAVPVEEEIPAAEPTKAEVENAEDAFNKLEEVIPLEEEVLPEEKREALDEQRIIDLMLEFEKEITPGPARVAEEVAEEEIEGPAAVEAGVPGVVEKRSYKGLAIASAGGLVYALGLILFLPLLGNLAAAVLIIPAAVMIVGGSNIALREGAVAERNSKLPCPLCGAKIERTAKECLDCGALFPEEGQ